MRVRVERWRRGEDKDFRVPPVHVLKIRTISQTMDEEGKIVSEEYEITYLA